VLSEVFAVSPQWSAHFLLVLGRVTAAVVAAPLFGARAVPSQIKVGLSILLSLMVLPLEGTPLAAIPVDLFSFASAFGMEILIGIAFGIGVMLVFQGMEMAASIVSIQMGFGLGEIFDPLTGVQTGALEQFYKMLVTLIFFAMNGHYLVIQGILHTFEVIPPGTGDLSVIAGDRVAPFFGALLVTSIQIALPVFGALMLTDLAMALVGRTVPQLNVLVVGFPVKIGVGLVTLVAAMPLMTTFISATLGRALMDVNGLLRP
jgi:flagellar biosynthetic protein FliR